ncbi:MAG: hypothetical protein Ta2G_07860 [Termitinemataceae bacterium]|nr:MAG: hypothetical protein Ta2G_07860 [Termitinemataceae bacterium]
MENERSDREVRCGAGLTWWSDAMGLASGAGV